MKVEKKLHPHDIDRLAAFNAIFSGLALYPQAYKTVITGSAGDLSFETFFVIFCTSVIWLLYACHRMIIPLVASSVLNATAALVILWYL